MPENVTILVNQRPYHLDSETTSAEAIRTLASAPSDYEVWKQVKSPDAPGQPPVDDVLITGALQVKSGDKFRVVPSGTFGAR
ncbi:MAG: hypothetical protein IPH75_16180 [bacterium]|nr:hypothetical protein [bacterium]